MSRFMEISLVISIVIVYAANINAGSQYVDPLQCSAGRWSDNRQNSTHICCVGAAFPKLFDSDTRCCHILIQPADHFSDGGGGSPDVMAEECLYNGTSQLCCQAWWGSDGYYYYSYVKDKGSAEHTSCCGDVYHAVTYDRRVSGCCKVSPGAHQVYNRTAGYRCCHLAGVVEEPLRCCRSYRYGSPDFPYDTPYDPDTHTCCSYPSGGLVQKPDACP